MKDIFHCIVQDSLIFVLYWIIIILVVVTIIIIILYAILILLVPIYHLFLELKLAINAIHIMINLIFFFSLNPGI